MLTCRLMRIHIEALFTHDARGRMIRVNEPGGGDAPRFFLGRTSHGNEWAFRHDVPGDIQQELERACLAECPGEHLLLPPYGSRGYEEILARCGPSHSKEAGPAYCFPDDLPASTGAIQVTDKNSDLLRAHLEPWLPDVTVRQPFVAFACVIGGHAVSICCSVRITDAAHEAGVETAPEFRGRGYARQTVTAWASAVRRAGRIPLYSTSWRNLASQSLAQKLGLVQFGSDLHVS